MFALLSPRVWIAVAVVIALAASHWKAYRTGQDAINAEWQADIAQRTAQALEASETARADDAARARVVVGACAQTVQGLAALLDERNQQLVGLQDYVRAIQPKP